jgi:hypothetical protein
MPPNETASVKRLAATSVSVTFTPTEGMQAIQVSLPLVSAVGFRILESNAPQGSGFVESGPVVAADLGDSCVGIWPQPKRPYSITVNYEWVSDATPEA